MAAAFVSGTLKTLHYMKKERQTKTLLCAFHRSCRVRSTGTSERDK
jgi:hypothetical protein